MHTGDRKESVKKKPWNVFWVAAYCNGRDTVTEYDALLLQHVLWQRPEQADKIADWVVSQLSVDDGLKQRGGLLAKAWPWIHALIRLRAGQWRYMQKWAVGAQLSCLRPLLLIKTIVITKGGGVFIRRQTSFIVCLRLNIEALLSNEKEQTSTHGTLHSATRCNAISTYPMPDAQVNELQEEVNSLRGVLVEKYMQVADNLE
eukprot:1154873-Pelagomonas_calceolata.AAC.9